MDSDVSLINICFVPYLGTLQKPVFAGDLARRYPYPLDPFQTKAIAIVVSKQ